MHFGDVAESVQVPPFVEVLVELADGLLGRLRGLALAELGLEVPDAKVGGAQLGKPFRHSSFALGRHAQQFAEVRHLMFHRGQTGAHHFFGDAAFGLQRMRNQGQSQLGVLHVPYGDFHLVGVGGEHLLFRNQGGLGLGHWGSESSGC